MNVHLSIIIPTAPNENKLIDLSRGLAKMDDKVEMIIVHSTNDSEYWAKVKIEVNKMLIGKTVKWLVTKIGRAHQMNFGAFHAKGAFLWFLHADSIINKDILNSLKKAIYNYPKKMHYFKLGFSNDGPPLLMKVTEWAVQIRSQLWGIPFGDQGFCMSKTIFDSVGGFPENVSYGEDHVFVWKVRQGGFPIHANKNKLFTSARKYASNGWAKTSVIHNKLWIKQALPEVITLLKSRGII
ncbi:MAG: glycosyltransferase [Candidatus Marinimicrobia bacterium]|nr:glycosyltransferase [Candidatus Neomarinimicrobiota bacterium]MBL7010600.1 glycosyltransferase [Candidatus Neomarinimicrobiota bacterium]MBL7030085.1 glycosyltransferase [Candidatus Neomarinimicrobiota bacterium]